MKCVLIAVLAIHIVFSTPTEDREAKEIRYETNNGIKHDQNGTFRNTEIGNVLNIKGKDASGSRSDGSGKNDKDLESLDSNGKLKGNNSADENRKIIVMQSRINQNRSTTVLGSGFKEGVTLQPSISNGSLEGNNIKNKTGGMLETNQNSTNEMKSNSEVRIKEKVVPHITTSNSGLKNNQTRDQNIIPESRVEENVSLQPQLSKSSDSNLEGNKTMLDEEYDYEELDIRISANAMKSILGGR